MRCDEISPRTGRRCIRPTGHARDPGDHETVQGERWTTCDRTKRKGPDYGRAEDFSPVAHDYEHIGDEYNGLAGGGDYEVLRCRVCGRRAYSPLSD